MQDWLLEVWVLNILTLSISEVRLCTLVAIVAILTELLVFLEALLPNHVSTYVAALSRPLRCHWMLLIAVAAPELVNLLLHSVIRIEGLLLVDDVAVEEVR